MLDLIIAVFLVFIAFGISIQNRKKLAKNKGKKANYLWEIGALIIIIFMACLVHLGYELKNDYFVIPIAYLLLTLSIKFDIRYKMMEG